MHKLLTWWRGAPGAWSFSEILLAPFFPCVHVIHEIPLPKPFTITPLLGLLIFHLHCFTSHLVPLPLVLPPISYKTRALLSPMLVLFMCPRCQMVDTWCIVRHNTLIKLKNHTWSRLDANHSSNFETLKINSALATSTNISLEELLGIKNNYKIYSGCTGIDCFH
jgi:hypothetical protein